MINYLENKKGSQTINPTALLEHFHQKGEGGATTLATL